MLHCRVGDTSFFSLQLHVLISETSGARLSDVLHMAATGLPVFRLCHRSSYHSFGNRKTSFIDLTFCLCYYLLHHFQFQTTANTVISAR